MPASPEAFATYEDSEVRSGAALALQDLLICMSVPSSEVSGILVQLSPEERRLLWCARQRFSGKGSFYNFAVGGTGNEKEDLRAVGTLYSQDLTVEELYELWNSLIENIRAKAKFLAEDTRELWRDFSIEPISTLVVDEKRIDEDATKAIEQLLVPLTLSQDQTMPSFVASWVGSLLPEQRLLLCAMLWGFSKPVALYDVCFGVAEPNSDAWGNVQRRYAEYTGKATNLSEIRLALGGILSMVYFSRMLKGQDGV